MLLLLTDIYLILIRFSLNPFASPSSRSVPAYPATSAVVLLAPIMLPSIAPMITAPITVAKK